MDIYKVSNKQQQIYEYIKKMGSVTQSDIIEHFFHKFGYNEKHTAKVSVGAMLKKLATSEKIMRTTQQTEDKGCIDMNVWTTK